MNFFYTRYFETAMHINSPHSSDSVICYVPSEKIVLLGDSNSKDLYTNKWDYNPTYKFSDLTAHIPYDQIMLEKYMNFLRSLDFTYCISGHNKIMSKQGILRTLEMQKRHVENKEKEMKHKGLDFFKDEEN